MVVAVGRFKNHFSIWFYKGVFLQDTHSKLINAQEGKTKGHANGDLPQQRK
ncbi:hypothetical protein [Myroides odoratus]|uniref:hypothetical protein n=1 Tax=Myroides odoratus TaxID=256 RepID=UPI0039AFEA1D